MILSIILFIACEAEPLEETTTKFTDLSVWNIDPAVLLTVDAQSSPVSGAIVYNLGVENLIDSESSTFDGGTTGSWVASAPAVDIDTPATFTNSIAQTGFNTTNCLHIRLEREPDAEYIYFPFDVTADNNSYIFKADYKTVSGNNIYISLGTSGADDSLISYSTTPNEVSVVSYSFDVLTATSGLQIRFSNSEFANFAGSFEMYLDDIALFQSSGHSINTSVSVDHTGEYEFTVYAKSNLSDKMIVSIEGDTKYFSLTNIWAKYKFKTTVEDTNLGIEIKPVSAVVADIFPGDIYISSAQLTFKP